MSNRVVSNTGVMSGRINKRTASHSSVRREARIPRDVFIVMSRKDFDLNDGGQSIQEIVSTHTNLRHANERALELMRECLHSGEQLDLDIRDIGTQTGDKWTIPEGKSLDDLPEKLGVYWSSRGEARYVEKDVEWMYWVMVVRKRLYTKCVVG